MEVTHSVSSSSQTVVNQLTRDRGATKAKFELAVNVAANTITLVPVEPMSPESVAAYAAAETAHEVIGASLAPSSLAAETPSTTTTIGSPQTSAAANSKDPAKDKVPRPPNAFIIYRQEWHPKVVEENPDLHNNDICKHLHPFTPTSPY